MRNIDFSENFFINYSFTINNSLPHFRRDFGPRLRAGRLYFTTSGSIGNLCGSGSI